MDMPALIFTGLVILLVIGVAVEYLPRSRSRGGDTRTAPASSTAAPAVLDDSDGDDLRFADPKDSAMHLAERGWEQVSDDPERWVGRYEANGRAMLGGVERTPGGRRRFYVQDPPSRFVEQAEGGNCLVSRSELLEDAYQVHFQQPPDSFGDGIDRIEELLAGGQP